MKHISECMQGAAAAPDSRQGASPPRPEAPEFLPLDRFQYDHLDASQQKTLKTAVKGARIWMSEYSRQEGMIRPRLPSFCITGPIGTGKTTIAANMMSTASTTLVACDLAEDGSLVPVPGTEFQAKECRFYTATEIMAVLDPARRQSSSPGWGEIGRGRLGQIFHSVKLIVVDDLGTEEIPYTRAEDKPTVRANRYRELLDYAGHSGTAVIITSMIPLFVQQADGQLVVNDDFIQVLGPAAFSRLMRLASGFMFDLAGLPDYRPIQAKIIRKRRKE